MKITVYFETKNNSYAEQVAVFYDHPLYIACLPALKRKAKASNYIVTESIGD